MGKEAKMIRACKKQEQQRHVKGQDAKLTFDFQTWSTVCALWQD